MYLLKELPLEISSKESVGESLLNWWRKVKLEILRSCFFFFLSDLLFVVVVVVDVVFFFFVFFFVYLYLDLGVKG